uniref:uncharacterized protein LOC122610613 n=1 Tax=Erigeron canadensis TaxID=72917 RepID=UPI001CB90268|nr:uncharacterized protein LOC122610613 [Erigeron canadensis]
MYSVTLCEGGWVWKWRRGIRSGVEDEQFIHLTDRDDSWMWNVTGQDSFSVRQLRPIIDHALLPSEPINTRWNPLVPKKINVFLWRLVRDRLPSRFNLSRRGLDISSISCPICLAHVENSVHTFVTWSFAAEVYNLITKWLHMDISKDRTAIILEWIQNNLYPKKFKRLLEATYFVWWWSLWKHRNQTLYNGVWKVVSLSFTLLFPCRICGSLVVVISIISLGRYDQ